MDQSDGDREGRTRLTDDIHNPLALSLCSVVLNHAEVHETVAKFEPASRHARWRVAVGLEMRGARL